MFFKLVVVALLVVGITNQCRQIEITSQDMLLNVRFSGTKLSNPLIFFSTHIKGKLQCPNSSHQIGPLPQPLACCPILLILFHLSGRSPRCVMVSD